MADISEYRVDLLEEKIRAKIDTMTGFSDVEGKSRALEKVFKYFDVGETGRIDYSQFFAAMTRLNFVGVQRELETLFDRYDEDCSNKIDYKTFCDNLFGMGQHIAMNSTSRSVLERVKSIIFARGGVSGLRGLCSYLKRMDRSGSGLLERSELCECLANFGLDADDGPGGDIDRVMGFFDRDGEGRINIREFHRGLRGNMIKRRQLVVKEGYESLTANYGGFLSVEDIRRCYDSTSHPDVSSGLMSSDQAMEDLVSAMCPQETEGQTQVDEVSQVFRYLKVNFCDFMDYFRDISAAIENDDYFQALVMNCWILPASYERDDGDSIFDRVSNDGKASPQALGMQPDESQEGLSTENGCGMRSKGQGQMSEPFEEQAVR